MRTSMKILFTASIALNVLLLGAAGGMAYKHWAHAPWHEVRKDLSPESRNLLARAFQKKREDIRPLGKEARQAKGKLVEAMSAENFDEQKFDEASAALAETQRKIMAKKMAVTRELAAELPPEERRKLAGHLARAMDGWKHGRRGGGDWKKRREGDWREDKTGAVPTENAD